MRDAPQRHSSCSRKLGQTLSIVGGEEAGVGVTGRWSFKELSEHGIDALSQRQKNPGSRLRWMG